MLLSIICTILLFTSCKSEKIDTCNVVIDNYTHEEAVKVTYELMHSHSWCEASFDWECVDSLQYDNSGYYWCIYDSPDQFETIRCVSMNHRTYRALKKLLYLQCKRVDGFGYIPTTKIYDEEFMSRFHLYYGNCEETILNFE